MISYIYMDRSGHKKARPVKNRKDYFAIRNTEANVRNFSLAREGNKNAKMNLKQFNYNDLLPNGVLKGCCHSASTFAHDIDCGDETECRNIAQTLLEKKEEIGLLELSVSSGWGLHAVCRREQGKTILENQVRLSTVTQTEMDTSAHDMQRVMFTGPATDDVLLYLDDAIFTESLSVEESAAEFARLKEREKQGQEEVPAGAKKANKHYRPWEEKMDDVRGKMDDGRRKMEDGIPQPSDISPQPSIVDERIRFIAKGVMKEKNLLESDFLDEGGRHTTVKMFLSGATQLLKKDETNGVLKELMPDHWDDENIQTLVEDFYQNYTNPSQRLLRYQENLFTQSRRLGKENNDNDDDNPNEEDELSTVNSQLSIRKMPQGVRDSIEAVGPHMAMPVVTAICPCIGALATGVQLDVHGRKKGLNLISYIAGDFASGKGDIDPVIDAWMSEVRALDKMYQDQEDEWRRKKRAAKNKKDQPEDPMLPIRCLTLNNTVAKVAERLAYTEGKHAFSFTPEADTVAQKWKTAMSDFSIMLRQSYDGSKYDREAKSVDAVNVHIEHLLWNVCMCGTPDALYRVVNNYTDGFQSRIAIARTPDNTFAPLEEKPYVLTDWQTERIQQIAHLLPLMQGEVELPKLEAKGREWLERIRLETMMNDDKVKARQRIRICVTAQRMTCCLMLCKVCEILIQKYGLSGAESHLKKYPNLWKELLLKEQIPQMLDIYDVIADSLMENALFFFRDRIENAFKSRDYVGNNDRRRIGKNDSIYKRLDIEFSFEHAMQHTVAVKGADVTHNNVRQMLKNWRNQGLIVQTGSRQYRKVQETCH